MAIEVFIAIFLLVGNCFVVGQNLNAFMSFANINWVTSSWANGDTVAWVQVKEGVANVFIASVNINTYKNSNLNSAVMGHARASKSLAILKTKH